MPTEYMVVDATMSLAPVYAGMLVVLAVSLAGIVMGPGPRFRVAESTRANLARSVGRGLAEVKHLVPRAGQPYAVNRPGVAK